jgi:membrane protease YdiL (CAAX protease family)
VELLVSLYLVLLFWPSAALGVLHWCGFDRWWYGIDLSAPAGADAGAVQQAMFRMKLWAGVLAFPFQVLTYPLVFRVISGVHLSQLGLTTRRLGRNLLLGLAGVVVLTPGVLGLYQLLLYLYAWSGAGTEKHPLVQVAEQPLAPAEWVLLVLSAVVMAPVVEEITFRGVLQPWFAARRWGGHVAMASAFVMTLYIRGGRLFTVWSQGTQAVWEEVTPALFVLALVPVYWLVWRRSPTPTAPAVFGTSLLFASFHASVWPSPVPLFVLALGLGWLAYRTRSLVGPIVLHSLFNGLSCLQLLWQLR